MFKQLKRKSPVEAAIYCGVSLVFMLVALSYIYIVVWTIISSLKTHQEIVLNPFSLPEIWNWQNYIEVMDVFQVGQHRFFEMLFNSIWFSVAGGFLAIMTSVTFAYCCTKYKFPGSDLVYTVILVMMTLPIYGSGGATYKIIYNMGMIDSYAHVLLSMAGMNAQFLYFRAYFKNLSWTYAEAAMMDGANHFNIYFRVMLPQAKPICMALFLTQWLGAWNNYETALLYLPNLPTLPVGIYQFNIEMVYRARLDILFAACLVVSIPALILFIAFNKVLTTNVSLGGIKG